MAYVENLHNIVDTYWNMYNGYEKQSLELNGSTKYSAEYIRTEKAELTNLMEKIKISTRNKINNEYTEYLSRLKRKVETISGGDISSEDLALLTNPYIKLNQTELDALLNKHKNNYTMLKALKAYVNANQSTSLTEIDKSALSLPDYIITPEEKEALAQQVYTLYLSFLSNSMSYAMSEKMYYEDFRLKLSE